MNPQQKFHKGDLVWIRPFTDVSNSHFRSGCYAFIVGSYADIWPSFDPTDIYSFEVQFLSGDSAAWYYVDELMGVEE